MQIILLSGGSGKRLWPLSNEARSKQFIKIFKREPQAAVEADGEQRQEAGYQSMLQRVYGQITQALPDATLTIATSRVQLSAVQNQLGNKTNLHICVEPSRRDTFPAILLAVAYLHDRCGVGAAETIAVCPVDPYVEPDFYHTLGQLMQQAEAAQLSLIGIEPTCPSEKYGYIIPTTGDRISRVRAFKEKPDAQTAQQYITTQHALWNAGVFVFKAGYLLAKARQLTDFAFRGYNDLCANYARLAKTSFDYAIVEREPDIQVMRYHGAWKDVGTWNMMTQVMDQPIKGLALMDEVCCNSYVINELPHLPVLAMGCQDLVIAVSNNGILVADSQRSCFMKPYVERIMAHQQEAGQGHPVRFAEKSWGSYTVIDFQLGALIVKLVVQPGQQLSYHSHQQRQEIWTVLAGQGIITLDGVERPIGVGEVITVAVGCKHRVRALTELTLLEVQLGDQISAEDKIKVDVK